MIQLASAVQKAAINIDGGYAVGNLVSRLEHSCNANAVVIIDIRHCCATCGNIEAKMKCGRCSSEVYCDESCQRENWTRHKNGCKPGRNALVAKPCISVIATRDIGKDEPITIKFGKCRDLAYWGISCREGADGTPCGIDRITCISEHLISPLMLHPSYVGPIGREHFHRTPPITSMDGLAASFADAKSAFAGISVGHDHESGIAEAKVWLASHTKENRDEIISHSGYKPVPKHKNKHK